MPLICSERVCCRLRVATFCECSGYLDWSFADVCYLWLCCSNVSHWVAELVDHRVWFSIVCFASSDPFQFWAFRGIGRSIRCSTWFVGHPRRWIRSRPVSSQHSTHVQVGDRRPSLFARQIRSISMRPGFAWRMIRMLCLQCSICVCYLQLKRCSSSHINRRRYSFVPIALLSRTSSCSFLAVLHLSLTQGYKLNAKFVDSWFLS